MKGDVESILRFIRNLKIFKKHFFIKYGQEVITLHLLTITLRRILNPPGFLYFNFKTNRCQNDSKMGCMQDKNFNNSILFVSLSSLRFFNTCELKGM